MELVLGLATLATAISGAAGAGHYDNTGPEIVEAEPKTVQVMNDNAIQRIDDLSEIVDLGPNSMIDAHVALDATASNVGDYQEENEHEDHINDTVQTAMDIGQYMNQNSWSFANYSSSGGPSISSVEIHGNIDFNKGVDWYTFTLYGKADVTIDLSRISLDCDYDVKLYKKANNAPSDYQITQISSSTYSGNSNEHIYKNGLYAGVYYVQVYSYRGFGSTQYYLKCDAEYKREDQNISIMTSKGAKGALWFADYDPFGIKPTSGLLNSNTVGTYYRHLGWSRTGVGEETVENSYHPEFNYTTGKAYKQAELFVWDDGLKRSLKTLFESLYTEAIAKDIRDSQLRMEAEVDLEVSKVAFNVIKDTAVAIVSIEVPVIGWIALGADFLVDLLNAIFPTNNKFANYDALTNYIENICIALGSSKGNGIPVRIPVYYKVNSATVTNWGSYEMSSRTTYTFSYVAPPLPQGQIFDFLYERSTISAVDWEGQSPFTGTIYPLFDGESSQKAWNRQSYDMSYQTLTNNGQPSTFSLGAGKYKWFKFKAPRTATFHITSEGDSEAAIEVFDNMVYGKSTYGRKTIEYQNNGFYSGFKYSKYLTEGTTIYFRVSGGYESFKALSSTAVKVSDRANEKTMSFYADELNLPTNWQDPIPAPTQYLLNKGMRVVAKENARINSDYLLELEADCQEEFFRAYVTIQFDRPIKSISFDAAYGTWWRYSRNPIIVNGLNSSGQTVITCWEDRMEYDFFEHYQRFSFLLKDPSQGVYEDIYSVQLMLDPYQTQDSYHNHYEMVHMDGFMVEFAD